MEHLIAEAVRYFNIVLLMLYTYFAYRVLMMKEKERQKRTYAIMAVLMYLIHGFSYLVLYLKSADFSLIVLYGAEVITLALASVLYQKCYKNLSQLVFQNMRLLLCFGYVMLARLSISLAVKQYLLSMAVLLLCLLVPEMIKRFGLWKRLGLFYLMAGLLLLLSALVFGKEIYGAINWVVIGGFRFQPSEFAKLLFVLGGAAFLSVGQDLKRVFLVTAVSAAYVLVLVLEKDLGGALLFFVTYLILLYCATRKWIYLGAGLLAGSGAAILAYHLFSHVRVRVMAFHDPFALIEKQGYQLSQSLFGIGTGGWFGLGLGNGLPESIPVSESDFIFSAIAEEMGGITAVCIALICLSCYILFVNLSVKIKDPFYKLTALGFSTIYIFQVFLNIAGVIKMIPSTGITLPFISSGGSSVISSILMFSLIQGIFVLGSAAPKTDGETAGSKVLEQLNKSIVWMTYVFSACMLSCIVYLAYFEFGDAKTVINNSYNPRSETLAKRVMRGKIYSSDGKILAQTVQAEEGEEVRIFPFGQMFSHTVGRLEKGKTGIEMSENFTLLSSDINGVEKLSLQMKGEKVPGNNIFTTLDTRLQKAAYNALGSNKGAVVVLEAKTGRILAMVSKPDYNPNTVVEDWAALIEDTSGNAPLLNRATSGLYPPGSTFKILTLLEYIRENPDYSSYLYTCKGSERNFDVTVHCAGNKAHGKQDLMESFANSCNSSFSNMGSTLDFNRLYALCEVFLFNRVLPGSLKASVSSFTLNNASDKIEVPQTVIGLGKTLVTPLHNAMIVQSIANGGVLMKPYLIDRVESADGKIIENYRPENGQRIISKEEADILTEYMTYVVEHGTASKLAGRKVSVAGKTGTAEYETGKQPHAWFVGFAPADHPEIVISVIVETIGSGSSYAVPIAKKVLEACNY